MDSRLRPEVSTMLEAMAALDRPPLAGLPPGELQATVHATLLQNADPCRDDLGHIEDVGIDRGDRSLLGGRVYAPRWPMPPGRPVVVFFHGGGYMTGDLDTHQALAADVSAMLDAVVLAVDYRRAPQHPFPAAADDALAALRWVDGEPPELGGPFSGIVLTGDSAGGALAAICATTASTAHPILCQWLMYASLDMDASGGSMEEFAEGYLLTADMMATFRDAYLPVLADRSDPRASPLNIADLSGAPPAMIFSCELDPLRDQARQYAARLVEGGVSVRYREGRGLVHGAFTHRRIVASATAELLRCAGDVESLIAESIANERRVTESQ
jgi:acetyl esterase